MALKGTLSDFPMSDIFQLIHQQTKSGTLRLTTKKSSVRVIFDQGRVVEAQSEHGENRDPLGALLVRAGLLSEEQLGEALAVQKRTLRRLGDILVSGGALSKEKLRDFLNLQTRETVYRLLRWKSGDYEFTAHNPSYDPDLSTPQSAQALLMDGFQIVDEWPSVRDKLGSLDAVLQRVPSMVDRVQHADSHATIEQEIDSAFGEWDGAAAPPSRTSSAEGMIALSPTQTRLWALVDGVRSVQEIIDRGSLGEFQTAKALADMIALGVVETTARRKPIGDERLSLIADRERSEYAHRFRGYMAYATTLAITLLSLLSAAATLSVTTRTTASGPLSSWSGAMNHLNRLEQRPHLQADWLVKNPTAATAPESTTSITIDSRWDASE